VEDEAVGAGLETGGEPGAAVGVGGGARDARTSVKELH
jgi:hypothetical protein